VLNAIPATAGSVSDSYIVDVSASKLTGSRTIPKGTMPAGAVLQVVQGTYATETSFTSTSFVATNLTASITPTSSTSKVLISAVLPLQSGASGIITYSLYRGATNLNSAGFGRWYTASADTNAVMLYLDSPSTTSATSYSVYIKTSASTAYYCINNETATIILQEIAA
jgi:hypothetical protein